jgi:methionyl-tRNA formyltransferase
MKKVYILLSQKKWHDDLFNSLSKNKNQKWIRINQKKDFNFELLQKLKPKFIMIPHWSFIISEKIFTNFNCIVFHMTNLPYGRGGSPLQNLIVRGHKETVISAIKVIKGIDTGPIYLKHKLELDGTALEIFKRSAKIILNMINQIIDKEISPINQSGEVTVFKRRSPELSDISNLESLEEVYNYIRMLDADGYPSAFLETKNLRIEFDKAQLINNKLKSNVTIIKK